MKDEIADKIKRVDIVHLEPGDVIYIIADHVVTPIEARTIREGMADAFPNNKVIVLQSGTELKIVRFPRSKGGRNA